MAVCLQAAEYWREKKKMTSENEKVTDLGGVTLFFLVDWRNITSTAGAVLHGKLSTCTT